MTIFPEFKWNKNITPTLARKFNLPLDQTNFHLSSLIFVICSDTLLTALLSYVIKLSITTSFGQICFGSNSKHCYGEHIV